MRTFHLRIFVGPTTVEAIARRLRASGTKVTVEGTESVHVVVNAHHVEGAVDTVVSKLREKLGRTYGISAGDFRLIREMAHASEAAFAF
jgi:hypothetical protein